MLLTSSRDNWERLVTAVVKKQQIWELCHQQSRSPSISTISSSDDLSERTHSTSDPFSVHPSPRFPPEVVSFSQVSNNASSRPFARMLFSAWYRMRKSKDKDLVDIPAKEEPALKRFSLRELQVATDKFSNKNIVWQDGFWKVYKGRLADGSLVSVKRRTKEQTKLLFQTEVEISRMAMHRNLWRLCGFCITRTERLLVYPYMANGSVASFLRDRPPNVPPLDWETRKRIALGSARGLSYLHDHYDQKIIHLDVKASNIFLDDELEAVVGDFSLAKLMDHNDNHVTTSVCGTYYYMAPEYLLTGEMSEKTDVYAYGITLLELITWQRAYYLGCSSNDDLMLLDWATWLLRVMKLEPLVDRDLQKYFVEAEVEQLIQVRRTCKEGDWERMVDAVCENNNMEDVVKLLLQVSVVCTRIDPKERPKMCEVVRMLEDGDGLGDETWKEWIQDEIFSELSRMRMQKKLAKYPYFDWGNR